MRIELDADRLRLSGGQTLKLRDGTGGTICCSAGTVWVTEEHQPRDVVLEAGACHRLSQRGVALVQALGDATVSFS
ncbi:MAG TPA: DUF2917 domain-containing protein [Burkholderiales bacterium]|nr:DUF2917 domain-containing protein [Burkholderiales bacterium]